MEMIDNFYHYFTWFLGSVRKKNIQQGCMKLINSDSIIMLQ